MQQPAVSYIFLYQNGQVTRLALFPYAGGAEAATVLGDPAGINNAGQVVGSFVTGNGSANSQGNKHAFFTTRGLTTDLGTLGGGSSGATAINNNGQVVGFSEVPGSVPPSFHSASAILRSPRRYGTRRSTPPIGNHAALWQNGTAVDLSAPDNGEANAINDQGQIVGDFSTGTDDSRAFVYRSSKLLDLKRCW